MNKKNENSQNRLILRIFRTAILGLCRAMAPFGPFANAWRCSSLEMSGDSAKRDVAMDELHRIAISMHLNYFKFISIY